MEKILSGKPVAKQIRLGISKMIAEYQLKPQMALIRLGDDPASASLQAWYYSPYA